MPSSLHHVPPKGDACFKSSSLERVSNSDLVGCGMRLPTLYSLDICPGAMDPRQEGRRLNKHETRTWTLHSLSGPCLPFLAWYPAETSTSRVGVSGAWGRESRSVMGTPQFTMPLPLGCEHRLPCLGHHVNQRRLERS